MFGRIAKCDKQSAGNGGLSVDDNKFLLFFGAVLIIIGLLGLKF